MIVVTVTAPVFALAGRPPLTAAVSDTDSPVARRAETAAAVSSATQRTRPDKRSDTATEAHGSLAVTGAASTIPPACGTFQDGANLLSRGHDTATGFLRQGRGGRGLAAR